VGTGAKEKEKEREAQAAPLAPVQPRPRVVQGVTYRTDTPLGTAYITVNHNGQGEPLEVFANVGKVGSETAAVSEAIGRLISLCLRLASPVAAKERVKQIVEQLGGIGGSRHLGFGKERVRSLPDAIAKVLAEHVGMIEAEEQTQAQLTLPERTGPPIKVGDPCPECGEATLAYEEGCLKCYGCGFAEC
jgi:ribonucleoside-diphosphate reductase alpha chain